MAFTSKYSMTPRKPSELLVVKPLSYISILDFLRKNATNPYCYSESVASYHVFLLFFYQPIHSFTTLWKLPKAILSISSFVSPIFSKQANRFTILVQSSRSVHPESSPEYTSGSSGSPRNSKKSNPHPT